MTDTVQRHQSGLPGGRISPPGETIADLLEERAWTQRDLAGRLGFSTKHMSQLIGGKAPITEETALRLERVLGSTAGFWLTREARYRERLARAGARLRMEDWVEWLDELPVRDLMRAGAISERRIDQPNKPEVVDSLLRFFGVASPAEWRARYSAMQVAFRRSRSDQCDVGAIAAWLRLGEIEAQRLQDHDYDRRRFLQALQEIRGLTVESLPVFEPRMRQLCRRAGVTVVFVPYIRRAHVSGVARWLNPRSALIQLSLYGKWNDRMWFTFFHEAAHLLLHARNKKHVFLDDPDGAGIESQEENEANEWAADFLIPREARQRLSNLKGSEDIAALANELGIHPGIIVGRMQHEGILSYRTPLNRLKARFEIRHAAD